MVRFEERYGGLAYSVLGRNAMEYGLDITPAVHPTSLGAAFYGVLDGDWTCGMSVLADGRTAMGPGSWPYRTIDRSVDQRLERHALIAEVHGWFHRTFECLTPSGVQPIVDAYALPAPVPEATGPADLWWNDDDIAIQATLSGWPPEGDRWTVRYFAREAQQTGDAKRTIYAAMLHETVPAVWCSLCTQNVAPGQTCLR